MSEIDNTFEADNDVYSPRLWPAVTLGVKFLNFSLKTEKQASEVAVIAGWEFSVLFKVSWDPENIISVNFLPRVSSTSSKISLAIDDFS